jgi:hypothetical protein
LILPVLLRYISYTGGAGLKRFVLEIAFGLLLSSIAAGEVSLRVCTSDGNTPFDTDNPIMVGTKLTFIVSSNSAEYWAGGLYVPAEYHDYGILSGRDCDEEGANCVGSILPAAGSYASVGAWSDEFAGDGYAFWSDSESQAGDWFIIDYTATQESICIVNFYDEMALPAVLIDSKTLVQVRTRDFNNDGNVNFADFAKLASYWQEANCGIPNNYCEGTDINPDGRIDFTDMMYFAEYWLEKLF